MADTHWYAEEGLGSGGDDGTTPADAFRTVKQLIEYNAFNAANVNKGWIRRSLTSTMAAVWNPADDGTAALPIQFIGWPRPAIPNTTTTEGDWTNGSTQVDNVVGITLVRGEHCGRYVTAPDGFQYMITRVGFNAAGGAVADMLLIDREYAGATVTTTDGKFQIEADEDYADRPAAGITAGWDADDIDLPTIDGDGAAYGIYFNADTWFELRNLEFTNFVNGSGAIRSLNVNLSLMGCLFSTTGNKKTFGLTTSNVALKRIIVEGNGVGTTQIGLTAVGRLEIQDAAFYNLGDNGLQLFNVCASLVNVNLGVEGANGDSDVQVSNSKTYGVDVKMGGTNGYFQTGLLGSTFSVENWGKELDINKTAFPGGEYISIAVAGETPNKKLSDIVLKITPNINLAVLNKDQRVRIPLGIVNMDAGIFQTVTWNVYNNLGMTINDGDAEADIYIEAGYVDSYSDPTAYTKRTSNSTEHTIADAADADDWDTLSVVVNPIVDSLVYFNLVISIYDVNDFFLDPQMTIT